ncbi:MAG: hypothetical protein ABIK07_13700 [Planctomycetota bacterium]
MIEIVPVLIVAGLAGYIVYAIARRGVKGALFGQKILSTCAEEVVFHRKGVKHTFRLHKLEQEKLYGLEIGRWTGPFGETTAIVVSGSELHQFDRMIEQFVEQ